jgi:hypothetical protein
MSEELKPLPCPFCGGPIVEPLFTYYAICSVCKCEGPYDNCPAEVPPAEAIAAWNRRAQPEPAAPTVVEPVGWLESPHGAFRANPLYRHGFPPQSMAWQVPVCATPPRTALTDAEIGELAIQEQLLLLCDNLGDLTEIIRVVEQAHGIAASGGPRNE